MTQHKFLTVATLSLLIGVLAATPVLAANSFSPWGSALSLESTPGTSSELNTPFLDGCPMLSPDGRQLYLASDRPGGLGGLDIWVAERASPDGPFGAPVNLGAPINSPYNDFCPSPLRGGHRFMFVSNRPGGCGGSDIYLTRRHGESEWEAPVNLGCEVNSSADEAGPVLSFAESGPPTLYFSSNRAGGLGGSDLYQSLKANSWPFDDDDGDRHETEVEYQSRKDDSWSFGPAEPVSSVNSAYDDMQPSVRHDGRELVFASNRPGGQGGFDIWSASRDSTADDWSAPVNLGPNVNSTANETRPSLSWKGTTLLFGSNRPGGEGISDIYYTTRDRIRGR